MKKSVVSFVRNKNVFFIFLILILFVKGSDRLFNPYLWGEDGVIFTQQASFLSFKSLLVPYSGYLHLLPRIIAIIANQFDLIYVPYIYVWSVFSLMVVFLWVIVNLNTKIFNLSQMQLNLIAFVFISVCSLHQYGMYNEIMLNITNLQWFSSIILLLMTLDVTFKKRWYLLYFILSLTGPFCIFILMILILNGIIKRNLFNFTRRPTFYILILTSLIQILVILNSSRLHLDNSGLDYFFMFKKFTMTVVIAALLNIFVLWVLVFYRSVNKVSINVLLLSLMILGGGIMIANDRVPYLSPSLGGRYLFALFMFFNVYFIESYYKLNRICKFLFLMIILLIPISEIIHGNFIINSVGNYSDYKLNVKKYYNREIGNIPIAPDGWSFIIDIK